jgi:hypothetical protein
VGTATNEHIHELMHALAQEHAAPFRSHTHLHACCGEPGQLRTQSSERAERSYSRPMQQMVAAQHS